MDDINRRRIVQELKSQLKNSIGFYFDTETSGTTTNNFKQQILDITSNILQGFHDKNVIQRSKTSVDILYNQFSFKQKMKWILVNNLFPFIGRKKRLEINTYNTAISNAVYYGYSNGEGDWGIGEPDDDTPEFTFHDAYSMAKDMGLLKELKDVYKDDAKQIMNVTMEIIPVHSIVSIPINITLGDQ